MSGRPSPATATQVDQLQSPVVRRPAGVDGCRSGWLAAVDVGAGVTKIVQIKGDDISSLLTTNAPIVIDVPIGLPEHGSRQADLAARRAISDRASSVFPAPIRAVLPATTRLEASELGFNVDGRRCSCQVFAILPKILAVDAVMNPALQSDLVEGHPEVTFAVMADKPGLEHPKRRSAGRAERRELLLPHFPDLDEHLSALPAPLRGDALDAFAMLWTARRFASGGRKGPIRRFPESIDERDSRGLLCEIVA